MANSKKIKTPKIATEISGLVVLRGKHVETDEKGELTGIVGISLSGQDDQSIIMEVAVQTVHADDLKVDDVYLATFKKSDVESDFEVTHLNELDNDTEKMVIKGEITGSLQLLIKPEQEEFFYEGNSYTLELSEIEAE